MAKNFQQSNRKNKDSINQFQRPRNMVGNQVRKRLSSTERTDNIKNWVTFYRRNIHRFVEHYLGLKLHPFQKLMLYILSTHYSFVCIASRGSGKSFIIALFACCKAILWPNSKIIIVSGTKKQGGLIVTEKIDKELSKWCPNLGREIAKIKKNQNDIEVLFHNGSSIKVVPSSDTARGNRSTFTIYEEFRLIPKNIVDTVIAPFAMPRPTPYSVMAKYSHLKEEYIEAYISSAYYKHHEYMWKLIMDTVKSMYTNKDSMLLAFDYHICIYHNLKTERNIASERIKLDAVSFMMEYENLMFDEKADAYIKLKMFQDNQVIKKPFYPMRTEDYVGKKRPQNPYGIKKTSKEVRVISVDIAMRAGDENDNTAIVGIRLLPTKNGYRRESVYIETMNGISSPVQSLRIKQVWHDFEADYIVLDIKNQGLPIYDMLGQVTKDESRGIEYPAMTSYLDDKELRERTLAPNAIEIIYAIVGSAPLNTAIHTAMRDSLAKGMSSFLVDPNEGAAFMIETDSNYMKALKDNDIYEQTYMEKPYLQTQQLINETVNLDWIFTGGNIKVDEKSGARKDRYMALAYGNYFATLLELDLLKEEEEYDLLEFFKSSGNNNTFLQGYYN